MGINKVYFISQRGAGMASEKQIHVRLNDSEVQAFSRYMKETGQTTQDAAVCAIRQMITQYNVKAIHQDAKFTFIDLFAGIGGMRLGYEQAGGKCVYSNEWNKPQLFIE